jgi:hypothetical protein
MNNENTIQQLIYRRDRIDELIAKQVHDDAKTLLSMERMYVEAIIDYRSKHGGLTKIIL